MIGRGEESDGSEGWRLIGANIGANIGTNIAEYRKKGNFDQLVTDCTLAKSVLANVF